MKRVIKKLIPPIFIDIYHKIRKKSSNDTKDELTWKGTYDNWEEAVKKSLGYEQDNILEKVKNATLKVINGEAAYERDSVTFSEAKINWPLVAILYKIGIENNNRLELIDFGGALGSGYFQNKSILKSLESISWNVVEQTNFVQCGNKFIKNEELSFFESIESVFKNRKPNSLLVSCTLQYLDKPYEWLDKFLNYGFEYIIFDRIAFISSKKDRLTIQYTPENIYKATYPAWFFNKETFLKKCLEKYEVNATFDNRITSTFTFENNDKGYWTGFSLTKIK